MVANQYLLAAIKTKTPLTHGTAGILQPGLNVAENKEIGCFFGRKKIPNKSCNPSSATADGEAYEILLKYHTY